METMVAVEGNEAPNTEGSVIGVAESSEHIAADPVIYKLVRVDGKGRLVPATEDEVMVVEDSLEVNKSEHFVIDSGQTVGCDIKESSSMEKSQSDCSESRLESDNVDAARKTLNVPHELAVDREKSNIHEEIVPRDLGDSSVQPGRLEDCSNLPDGSIEKKSENSAVGANWKPDFSKLEGDICLDNLTVKELQETFKATFGRETSVKDKHWLKRRIVMGLTNSCDFSATSFVLKDGKVVKKGRENFKSTNGEILIDPVAENQIVSESAGALSDHNDNQIEANLSSQKAMNSPTQYNHVIGDHDMEQRANKRMRKPTKRYIEELSEVESRDSSEKSISSNKDFGDRQSHQEAGIRFIKNGQWSRPLIMRQDSIGGSGVQVPCVSRIRRGRPRENIMALVELQPSGFDMADSQVKKGSPISSPRRDDEKGSEILKSSQEQIQQPREILKSSQEQIQQPGNQHLDRRCTEMENGPELQNMDSFANNSDDNAVTMTRTQGGMRRKHHRPWTLSEVVKLVEGVAKYGAGRWSEIKRVAFASSSYRTSVDLKDKWRNLLRASFAQLPAEEGIQNSRKHPSVPIPAPILVRVRELAKMQGQVTPIMAAKLFAGHGSSGSVGRSVHEKSSGYL